MHGPPHHPITQHQLLLRSQLTCPQKTFVAKAPPGYWKCNVYFVSDIATCNFDFKILLEEPQKAGILQAWAQGSKYKRLIFKVKKTHFQTKFALPRLVVSKRDDEIGQETLSAHHTNRHGQPQTDCREGSGKKSVFSVDPKRLVSDKVLHGDCHMCLAYFPRRGTAEKTILRNLGI